MGIERLPSFALDAARPLGRRFADLGLGDYRGAAGHVHSLPYGRNSDRSDWRLVLAEGRGTCSTKHALLAELARENRRPVSLVLGVYEMDEPTRRAWARCWRGTVSPPSPRPTATWPTEGCAST